MRPGPLARKVEASSFEDFGNIVPGVFTPVLAKLEIVLDDRSYFDSRSNNCRVTPVAADSRMHLHPSLFCLECPKGAGLDFAIDPLAREGLAVDLEQLM